MAFVSITRLRIRSLRFMPQFFIHAMRIGQQTKHADGFLGGSLLADRRRTYWTMTLWRDQSAMRAYMTSGMHGKAMPKLSHWCDQASVVHWTQDEPTLPSWFEAERRMRTEGRPSTVRTADPGHQDLTYDPPILTGAVPITPAEGV